MPATAEGGLGNALVGDKININSRHVQVTKLLGEGGFSYVYLVKEISDALGATVHGGESAASQHRGSGSGASGRSGSLGNGVSRRSVGGSGGGAGASDKDKDRPLLVLKVTSILSRQQRDIAEKEAKLLSRLSHPSIIKMYDTCYRSVAHAGGSRRSGKTDSGKERPQHLILMEFCEGGHALDVCNRMSVNGTRFDLATLIIAFGQICNAVSYLHAQRPPIVHRDLKPANFLVKNGAYKLCDFGSAVFGHVDLKTQAARVEAEEVIQKTTTQMFRAPEMVDLYMAKKLTQATDVWALGCCLYSLAFLQNCFEEGSNLAILSRKYKIPDDNPYGEGLVELIDRMLTIDSKERADMTEVILCLSAVYSGRELPPRRERKKEKKEKEDPKRNESAGSFRTDAQGVYGEDLEIDPKVIQKQFPSQSSKPLKSNSAAARRRAAAQASGTSDLDFTSLHTKLDDPNKSGIMKDPFGGDPFASGGFASFDDASGDIGNLSLGDMNWSNQESSAKFDAFASFSPDAKDAQFTEGNACDENDDNAEEVEYAGEEDDRSRRRRSSTGRKGGSSNHDHNGSCDEDRGRSGTPSKRSVRRTRSGARRKSDHEDGKDEIEVIASASGSAESKEEEDEDDKHSRRRTPTNRTRRSHTGSSSETMKVSSQAARSSEKSSSSSRRDSHTKASPHSRDRDKDSSTRSTKDSSTRARALAGADDSMRSTKDSSSRARSFTSTTQD